MTRTHPAMQKEWFSEMGPSMRHEITSLTGSSCQYVAEKMCKRKLRDPLVSTIHI
jgi:hypothetical protein